MDATVVLAELICALPLFGAIGSAIGLFVAYLNYEKLDVELRSKKLKRGAMIGLIVGAVFAILISLIFASIAPCGFIGC